MVPLTPVVVYLKSPFESYFETPKSISFAAWYVSTTMLWGLMSQWHMFFPWADSSATTI